MRRKLVVGNWKMNKSLAEASSTIEAFSKAVRSIDTIDLAICPPFTSIDCARHLLRDSNVSLGAQDVFWKTSGAFTGQISATMLADLGCRFCIVGHSETRGRFGKLEVAESTVTYFSETDETVNLKLKALIYASVKPILCVGETLSEREFGVTDSVIEGQLRGALADVDATEFFDGVVAYEPVWAIGTGQVCDTGEAERVCHMIRTKVGDILDSETAQSIRILYGGSVKASNARDLFQQENIDGGLVGGASLNPEEFAEIAHAAR